MLIHINIDHGPQRAFPFTGLKVDWLANALRKTGMRPAQRAVLVQVASFILYFAQVNSARAESFFDKFKDPEDGAFDASAWLYDVKGFLPVPIIITEPAVGFGLGGAAVFFHETEAERARARKQMRSGTPSDESERAPPPSLSAVFGAYTENGTWLAVPTGVSGKTTAYATSGRWRRPPSTSPSTASEKTASLAMATVWILTAKAGSPCTRPCFVWVKAISFWAAVSTIWK